MITAYIDGSELPPQISAIHIKTIKNPKQIIEAHSDIFTFYIFTFLQQRTGILDKEIILALWNNEMTPNVVNNLRIEGR